MIEARSTGDNTTSKAETPETITVSMIIEDLDNGIDRTGIKTKYGLETWEVTQMFQHPTLKGRKAKKVKKLSFNFVDDTVNHNQTTIPMPDGSTIDELDAGEPAVEASMEIANEMEREMTYPSPTQQTAEAVSTEFADGQDDDDDDDNETNINF